MAQTAYTRQQLQALAQQDAARNGLGSWFINQISDESGFNPNAHSGTGAEGIAQFEPETAASVGLTDPYNPVASLAAAAKFDKSLITKYGSVQRALSAYNSGRPDAYLDPNFAGGQTYDYVKKILGGTTPPPITSPQIPSTLSPGAAKAVAKPASVSLAAAAANAVPSPASFQPQLAHDLATAAGAAPGAENLTSFYGVLAQALKAKQQGLVTAASTPSAAPAGDVAPVRGTSQGAAVVAAAKPFLGVPYKYGGNDPATGIDCSAFVQQTYAKVGVQLPRTTQEQFKAGVAVPLAKIQAGDVVYTEPGEAGPNHAGIYIGNGEVQESPHTGESNKVIPLKSFLTGGLVGVRRFS